MKTMKKLFALLLALTMVFGLAATGFAADETSGNEATDSSKAKIKITNPKKGITYNVYRLLALESWDANDDTEAAPVEPVEEDEHYAYKLIENSSWNAFLTGNTVKNVYLEIDEQNYVTWKDGASAEAFAALAIAYAKENSITNDGTGIGPESGALEISVSGLGWYLVDTSLGSLCSLGTTDVIAEIIEKNDETTIDKDVKEDSTGNWGDKNTAELGQVVEFRVTINAKKGADKYVLHDVMEKGLTFNGETTDEATDLKVVVDYADAHTGVTDIKDCKDYTLTTTDLEDGCTFELSIGATTLNTLENGDTIYIYYTATVNDEADILTDPNTNKATLTYGEDNKTEESITNTYVFELNVFKFYDANGAETGGETALPGAKFVLYRTETVTSEEETTTTTTTYYAKFNSDMKLDGWTTDKDQATTLTSGGDGYIQVDGLDAGTYFLEETKAPDGFNKLPGAIEVTIDEQGSVKYKIPSKSSESTEVTATDEGTIKNVVDVLNQSGTELPSTGGMGTTLFYVVGSLMVLGAAVLLVAKKRSNT